MRRDFKAYQRSKANTDIFIKKVEALDIKNDEWDAVSYFASGVHNAYRFMMIKFFRTDGKDIGFEMNENGLGYKFLMIHADDGVMKIEEAVLGDPTHIFLHNLIRGGHQGYLIKKCPQGIKLANEILIRDKGTFDAFKQMMDDNAAIKV